MDKTRPISNGECNCCIEERTLYPCEIQQCSWRICEKCYKKTYNESDKCPACRNSIKYKFFTPKIAPLEEVHIDINNLERGSSIRETYKCFPCNIRLSCYKMFRIPDPYNEDQIYNYSYICNELLCFLLIFIFILCGVSLGILFGRWIMWILVPGLSYYIFWVPWFLFILYAICGICIASAVTCCFSLLLISCCKEEFNNDW